MLNQSRHIILLKIVGLLLTTLFVTSCILFKKKCPLPTCEIRKTHRHLLIFSKQPKAKKSKKKKNNLQSDSTTINVEDAVVSDSTEVGQKQKSHKHDHEGEHEATYVEVDGLVLDEEGNVYQDPKEKKRQAKLKKKAAKKAAKKKKKEEKLRAKGLLEETDQGDDKETDEELNDYSGLSEEEYKELRLKEHTGDTLTMHTVNEDELAKQLKAEDKAAKKAAKKARKGKRGQADYTRLYRSRITKWWRRDQNPKIGKHFKRKKNAATRIN